ncbi:hypothetical protein BLS_003536 [Venturia inaequalis]|uniref:Uncharacterized protein n=1 Tax=Venturia inaequalis TaxID=5025 RepID=A0A8H3VAB8_VENIN|nr:hypothetical protein BLS_003536 [Venturia inaequalis]KAE9985010.1 hypothetical protein EG328_008000 [Venturia inaequalis]
MDTTSDPWDWTVDEVVQEFCYARTIWRVGHPNACLPDPVLFERLLRENDVEGSTLLTDLGHGELKDDFGIKSLGQRSALKWGIGQFRNRSEKYLANQQSSARLEQVIKSESQPPTPFRSFSATPGHSFSPGLPTIKDSPVRTLSARMEEEPAATGADIPQPFAFNNAEGTGEQQTRLNEASKRQGSPSLGQTDSRKKRRLNLPPPVPSLEVSAPATQAQANKPTTTSFIELPTRTWLSSIESKTPSYLGPCKLTPDDIFFGSGGMGNPLNADIDMKPLTEDGTDSSGFQIYLGNCRSIPGRQRYVYRQMVHFLRQPLLSIKRHGKPAMVIFPYNQSASITSDTRSALVFTPKDGDVEATRERAAGLIDDTPQDEPPETNSNHEWDFLLQKYGNEPAEKTPLPCYGKSEPDTEWSECERELQAEEQAEVNTAPGSRGPLTKEKVKDVIEEEISGYIATWQKQKQPLREHGAWKIWKAKPIDRRIAIDRERAECLHTSERLAKLKKGISDDIWHTAKSVRDQCKSLEQTVIQQEEAVFKLDVLQRTKQPFRPAQNMKAKKKRVKVAKDNDDISLGSDSEVATETESLNGFMEIDEEPVAHLDLTQRFDSEESVTGIDNNMAGNDMAGDEEMADGDNDVESKKDSVLGAKIEPGAGTSHSSREAEVIDLTSDTEDQPLPRAPSPTLSSPVVEPERTVDTASNDPQWGRSPLRDSNEDVAKWNIDVLNERDDYKRILIKLLLTMPPEEFSELRTFFVNHKSIPPLVKMVEERIKLHAKGIASDQDPLGADEVLRLYLCWVERNSEHFNHVLNNGVWGFKSEIQRGSVHRVRDNFRKADNKSLKDCCVFLQLFFQRHTTPILPPPTMHDLTVDIESARSSVSDSSDDGSDSAMVAADSQGTPHKKRKREVAESQSAKEIRERTRRTQKEENARAARFLQQQSSQLGISQEKIVVNPGKKDGEEEIYINDYLADKVKPHQIDGIRFLWSSIVASTKKRADMQGCLLAHTMGLGKTMQAITFLITIAEACADEKRRDQIPKPLREQRNLVICPSSLIFNWEAEFGTWDKHCSFGGLWSIDSLMTVPARLQTIQTWYEKTGILLISYNMIRTIINNNTKPNKNADTDEAPVTQYDLARKLLLEGTSLIVADEAHQVKNLGSKISKAVKLFKTTSRIALTGSPLSNNLTEYFSMIEWISPGYLGDQVEFKALYVEPIEQGNSSDCTGEERRLARKKLRALQEHLDPKIHRRDVTVLKGSLKPKIEFMIKIPLTDVQFEAYIAFVNLFCRSEGSVNNTKLWAWMHKLALLCSHPLPFWKGLLDDNQGNQSPQDTPSTDSNDLANIDEAELTPVKIPPNLMDTLRKLFTSVKTPLEDAGHSNKSALLLQILKFCIKKGDKILVFSQSIPTLDFLGSLLSLNNIKFFRLDGQTKMKDRPEMIKSFNKAGSKYDVFLISTKAGGLGFNLPGANRVVIYDFSFNPTHEEQAIGRAYRLGQTKPVFVYRFISAGTFEENMNNNTVFKTQLAYRVVEKKNIKAKATRQNEWLRDPKRVKQDDLSEHTGKDGILDQVLETPAGQLSICGISTSEVLQQEHDETWTAEEEAEVKQFVADEQRRLEDPIGWLAESKKRQLVFDQVSEQRLAADTAARARAAQGLVMGPPRHRIPYVLPPSTFQEKPLSTFGGLSNVNGLPSNLPSSTAPVQRRATDVTVRAPHIVQPGTPRSRPLSSPVPVATAATPKATTEATPQATPRATSQPTPQADSPTTLRKESPATGNPKQPPATGTPSPAPATINGSSKKWANGTHPRVPPATHGSLKASENNSPSKGVRGNFDWIDKAGKK